MNNLEALTQKLPWHQNPKVMVVLKKIIALSLILFSLFHIYDSIRDILFILPKISFMVDPKVSQKLYLELIKKAILISTSLFLDSFYGFALLIKPTGATKIIHLVFGIFLFILSNIIFKLSAIDQILTQVNFLPLT